MSFDKDDEEFNDEFKRVIDDEGVPHAEEQSPSHSLNTDPYTGMQVGLPRGSDGEVEHAVVKRRKTNENGNLIGTAPDNPLTDTRVYEVEYLDGTIESLAANVIAENLLSQVDEEGHRQLLMQEIIDHRCNDQAVQIGNDFHTTANGTKRRKLTTRGWELCVEWKGGSQSWVDEIVY